MKRVRNWIWQGGGGIYLWALGAVVTSVVKLFIKYTQVVKPRIALADTRQEG